VGVPGEVEIVPPVMAERLLIALPPCSSVVTVKAFSTVSVVATVEEL
jgi:hypothetical protein